MKAFAIAKCTEGFRESPVRLGSKFCWSMVSSDKISRWRERKVFKLCIVISEAEMLSHGFCNVS